MRMRIQQVVVLAIASLAVLAAAPSAQAQARGFHGGTTAHVARGSNYGRGFNYGRGYGYGRGWGYGPGWGWGPAYGPYYPPVFVTPPAYDQYPPIYTQVPVQEWNGYEYVTVYITVPAYYDYSYGGYFYFRGGHRFRLR